MPVTAQITAPKSHSLQAPLWVSSGLEIECEMLGNIKRGGDMMDFYKVPMGFGMALAMNFNAMNAYSALSEEEKKAILDKAHNAQSEEEMHQLVNSLVN